MPFDGLAPEATINAEDSPLYRERRAQDVWRYTEAQVAEALQTDAVARRVLAKGQPLQPGDLAGSRLNLNVLKSTGVPVMTVHRPTNKDGYRKGRGWYRGAVTDYQPILELEDAFCNVDQKARERIAARQAAKSPMASIDGRFVGIAPNFDGIECRFNPHDVHLFVDLNGFAIRWAERVTLCAHRAYLRGRVEYYMAANAPQRAGDAPSNVRFIG